MCVSEYALTMKSIATRFDTCHFIKLWQIHIIYRIACWEAISVVEFCSVHDVMPITDPVVSGVEGKAVANLPLPVQGDLVVLEQQVNRPRAKLGEAGESRTVAWGMTSVLVAMYVINFADKAVLGIIAQ